MKRLFYSVMLLFIACSHNQSVKAKIFQRQHLQNGKLLITFRYSLNGKQYVDSSVVSNVSLPGDTIDVIVNASNPVRAIADVK